MLRAGAAVSAATRGAVRSDATPAPVGWDALGLLTRLSIATPLLVGGFCAVFDSIQSFAAWPLLLIVIGTLLIAGRHVRPAAIVVVLVMLWFAASQVSPDKSLNADLKRTFRTDSSSRGISPDAIIFRNVAKSTMVRRHPLLGDTLLSPTARHTDAHEPHRTTACHHRGTATRRPTGCPGIAAWAHGHRHLVAHCRERADIRWFRFERIERADATRVRYRPRPVSGIGVPPSRSAPVHDGDAHDL